MPRFASNTPIPRETAATAGPGGTDSTGWGKFDLSLLAEKRATVLAVPSRRTPKHVAETSQTSQTSETSKLAAPPTGTKEFLAPIVCWRAISCRAAAPLPGVLLSQPKGAVHPLIGVALAEISEIASAPLRCPEVDDEGLCRPPFVVAPLGGEGRVLVDRVVDRILALEDGQDAAKVAAARLEVNAGLQRLHQRHDGVVLPLAGFPGLAARGVGRERRHGIVEPGRVGILADPAAGELAEDLDAVLLHLDGDVEADSLPLLDHDLRGLQLVGVVVVGRVVGRDRPVAQQHGPEEVPL